MERCALLSCRFFVMGKKPQRHNWPEAKKLCRLNQDDIAMARSLGFGPDALIRARKLPVKYWIHELHYKRFGFVVGERPLPAPPPAKLQCDEEAVRLYGEQLYWEDYWERNRDDHAGKPQQPGKSVPAAAASDAADGSWIVEGISDGDVPF
jgi:hypothetical protein